MASLIALLTTIAMLLLVLAWYAHRYWPQKARRRKDPRGPRKRTLTQRQQNWLWGLGAAAVATMFGRSVFGAWSMGLLFSVVGVGAPGWVLHRRQERQRARMTEQLEQLMRRLAHSMSGSSATPEMAWMEAAAEVNDPLGVIVREVAMELKVGRGLDEILLEKSHYLGIPEFELVAMSTAVLSGMGGNLAECYRRTSDTIGARRSARATLQSLTMDTRLNGHIVAAVPFLAFVSLRLIVPHYVEPVLASTMGLLVLGAGSAFVIVGWAWMLRIADVDRLE